MTFRTNIMLSLGAGLLAAIFTGQAVAMVFVLPFAVFALSAIELARLLLGGHVLPD